MPAAMFTLTLPDGIVYPPPEPPASAAGNVITMPLPELSPHAEGTIHVQVYIPPETPAGTVFEVSYSIDVAEGELAPEDNAGVFYVIPDGRQFYLPSMMR